MSSPLGAFAERWAPRVGVNAARLGAKAYALLAVAGLLVPVWGILFLLQTPAAHSLAIAILALDVGVFFVGMLFNFRLNRTLSQELGVKVTLLNSPTLRDGAFESWCERHGATSQGEGITAP